MINSPTDDKKYVKIVEPRDIKDEDDTKKPFVKTSSAKQDHSDQKPTDDGKYKKGNITLLSQGYDYDGEKSEIGIILALKNDRFVNKVVFTTFIEK